VRGARVQQAEGPPWLHPGRSARFARGRELFGWFGQLHPKVARAFGIDAPAAVAELDVDSLRAAPADAGRMEPVSRFPILPFDVAVVVDRREPTALVEETIRKSARERVRSVALFDLYEGPNLPPGKKSLAFHVVFGAPDHTIDTAEAESLRKAVVDALARRGWTIRA
jgi:phenylalanyl-tRNA synthetase beta chain